MDEVTTRLSELRIIPVVRLDRVEDAEPLAQGLTAGGLPCAEITLRTSAAIPAIERLVAMHPDILVGAGTVLDVAQAKLAAAAGARFIVSPGLDSDLVTWCQDQDLPVFPGVATPTDLMRARQLGLSIVKLFPAEAIGGIETLKALRAPFPGMRFIPTGGIDATNARSYLELDAVFAVGGSFMVPGDALRTGDVERLTRLAQTAVRLTENDA